ncbi:SpaA isopeptide-forming pilin-related protein [Butyrivibrio sp. AE3006]|uniref:SpaA isopeptide-forming pilin-related protein n=1 Tax=Butyrivibrio sp. AE3006 TaxID=1280673 RepID=UPI00041B0564|nr:SpaA isopeptide-forming pilin-related protein [Butyrivibrio sp. AE3006]
MKGFKKLLTGILAGAMALSMTLTAGTAMTAKADTTTGTVTIKDAVVGEKYQGYEIFSATISSDYTATTDASGITYKWAGTENMPDNDFFTVNAAGYIDATDKAYTPNEDGKRELTSGAIALLKGWVNGDAVDGEAPKNPYGFAKTAEQTATGGEGVEKVDLVFSDLAYGYWYFTSTVGTVVSIDSSNPTATVKDKNVPSTSEKQVEEDSIKADTSRANGVAEWGDRNDADINQTVNFRSTVSIKPGQRNVVFHDQMKDTLDLDEDSIVVGNLAKDTDYVLTTGQNGDTFTVAFTQEYLNKVSQDTTVTIKYSATLTENAIVGVPSGEGSDAFGAGNDNQSRITYGDNQYTEWDWTRTYTWSFDIFKYTGENTPLAGAKFKVYKAKDTEKTTPLTFKDLGVNEDGVQVYEYATGDVTELVTPESGNITVKGVDADVYTLEETEAPAGFNKIADDIEFTVESATKTQVDSKAGESLGQVISAAVVKKGDDTVDAINVLNESGVVLPSTGGIGTTIFYIVGGLLIVAAAVFFVVRRKGDAE